MVISPRPSDTGYNCPDRRPILHARQERERNRKFPPQAHTRVPHQMKLSPWTCLFAAILIATTAATAADQTIFDKSLIQRRPEVHPLTSQSFLE